MDVLSHQGTKAAHALIRSALKAVRYCAPLLMLGSFAVTWAALGTDALYDGVAHESEPRSLLEVVLFPGHALRELPHVFLLALCWVAGAHGRSALRPSLLDLKRVFAIFAAWCALLFVWATLEDGSISAWQQLAQSVAAPGLHGAGAHFRYHLWSDVALALLFFGVGRALATPSTGHDWLLVWAILLFAAMLLAWGVHDTWSPRSIGHQAREVFTYTLLSLPCLVWVKLHYGEPIASLAAFQQKAVLLPLGAAVAITALLAWGVLHGDVLRFSSNPTRGPLLNLAVHNFEHLLDLVPLLGAAAWTARGCCHWRVQPAT